MLAFLNAILPLLAAIGGGSAVAGGAALVGAGASIYTSLASNNRQKQAQKDQRRALAASETSSQEAYRTSLRSTRGRGTGDFQTNGGAFGTALRQITGR